MTDQEAEEQVLSEVFEKSAALIEELREDVKRLAPLAQPMAIEIKSNIQDLVGKIIEQEEIAMWLQVIQICLHRDNHVDDRLNELRNKFKISKP